MQTKAPLNWRLLLAFIAWCAFWFVLADGIHGYLYGQTRLRAEQVLGGLPAPIESAEAQWCPGPAMTLEDSRTLVIGPNWSEARPCFAHFNLSPPATIDPVHVSSFRAPARVTISPESTTQDELYIHLQPPAFSGGTMARPQRIVVTATQPGMLACDGCTIETAGPGPRIFPAFSMPVGMASVTGGRFHPVLDSIIETKQIYIGADLGIAVRRDGAGLWLELSSVQARAATAALQLEQARARATANILESAPPSRRMVETVSAQLTDIRKELDQVRSLMPPVDYIEPVAVELEQARHQAESLQTQLYDLEARLIELRDRMMVTVVPDSICESGVGWFKQEFYACDGGRWRRVRLQE